MSEPPQPPTVVASNDTRWYVEWDGVWYFPDKTERNLNGAKKLYWKLYKEWERKQHTP